MVVRLLKRAGFEYVHSVVSRVMLLLILQTTTTAASCASTSRTLHIYS